MSAIDLDFYTWREPVTIDGVARLVVPLSDPMVYEHPADGIFTTVEEAIGYLTDWWDHEDTDHWVLVHYKGERLGLAGDLDSRVQKPFGFPDWQHEVANGDTVLGFEDWVAHQEEAYRWDDERVLDELANLLSGPDTHYLKDTKLFQDVAELVSQVRHIGRH